MRAPLALDGPVQATREMLSTAQNSSTHALIQLCSQRRISTAALYQELRTHEENKVIVRGRPEPVLNLKAVMIEELAHNVNVLTTPCEVDI